jgi:hypothetical protein
MRNRASGVDVGQAALDLLDHVEMVENVVERAVIGKAVQEFLNLLLGLHWAPPAAAGASQRRCMDSVPRIDAEDQLVPCRHGLVAPEAATRRVPGTPVRALTLLR